MAEASTPQPAQDTKPENPNSHPPNTESQSNSAPPQSSTITPPPPPTPLAANPNSGPTIVSPGVPPLQPAPVNPYGLPPSLPQFRPAGAPISAPQFTPVHPNPNLPNYQMQGPGVPPPGVNSAPGMVAPPPMVPGGVYQVPPPGQPPNPLVRPPYITMNSYMPPGVPPGTLPPPGVPRYPYQPILRPAFPLRPPGTVGVLPPISRPPMLGIRPPVITSIVRPPVFPVLIPAEKPQTTVYVGKIAQSVENDFMLSLLQFCGPVKSWKRPQDPSNGTPKAFGFCEFESAEGVLRSLRLLSKLNIDGQELMLNVNKATRDYLERYVEKKKENSKPKEIEEKETEEGNTKEKLSEGDEINEQSKPPAEESQDKNESENKENDISTFGLVSDEDREADREATEKISTTLEERLKNRPLPPPPPLPQKADVIASSNSEGPAKSGEKDSDADVKKDDKNDDEITSETKLTRAGTESPERGRRYDGRGRERDRDRDQKREKERELERIERERERERGRRERERELEIQKAERLYKERVKEWETREREREYQRKYEKEREKEKERERRRLVQDQEDESDDDSRRPRRRSDIEDRRKRKQREREEDLADRLKEVEEEEIAEAKRIAEAEERQKQLEKEALQLSSAPLANGKEKVLSPDTGLSDTVEKVPEQIFDSYSGPTNDNGREFVENGSNDESAMAIDAASDLKSGGNAPAKKLGFGLSGLGKRTAVPSVFKEEDDEDSHKEKKMRPLVPIDYSAEELQAATVAGTTPPNAASAPDAAKRTTIASKDERSEAERDRSRRTHDRSSYRDRDQKDHESSRERSLDREQADKTKNSDNRNVLDAKQLIDMIPKTKEELFSFDINWAVYDKHNLQERIRPWIVKKITEFLGEEEATLVDYIVSSIQDHVKASQMLELLQSILDEEAEMFVLKMWRMLIFEIKRVETGLLSRPKA